MARSASSTIWRHMREDFFHPFLTPTLLSMNLCEFIVSKNGSVELHAGRSRQEERYCILFQTRSRTYRPKICIRTNSFVNITNQHFGMNSYGCWPADPILTCEHVVPIRRCLLILHNKNTIVFRFNSQI